MSGEQEQSAAAAGAPEIPGYWMAETSGGLRPAVRAYLNNEAMSALQIAVMRAYLRQWIRARQFLGPELAVLRQSVEELTSQAALRRWIYTAIDAGADPL